MLPSSFFVGLAKQRKNGLFKKASFEPGVLSSVDVAVIIGMCMFLSHLKHPLISSAVDVVYLPLPSLFPHLIRESIYIVPLIMVLTLLQFGHVQPLVTTTAFRIMPYCQAATRMPTDSPRYRWDYPILSSTTILNHTRSFR